jgi:CheY-like chemotaxis protein
MTAQRSYRHNFPAPEGVLCVSGDGQTAQELCRMLRKLRFRAEPAGSMAQALSIINRRPPALLLVDFYLNDGSGLELVHQLRGARRTAKIPVLMLATTLQAEHYRAHLASAGPQDWLHKPLDEDRLAGAVTQWVGVEISDAAPKDEIEIDPAPALADSGAISALPFARVLVLAGRRGAGRVCVERRSQWLRVWVSGETVNGLSSSFISDMSLGQMLIVQGRVSRYIIAEAQQQIAAGKRLGEWLCEHGYLTPAELEQQLRDQAMQKLTAVFSWRWYDACWQYEAATEPGEIQVHTAIPLRDVIFAGIGQHYDRERLEMIFSKRERLRRPLIPTTPHTGELTVPARRLLNAADGHTTAAQVRTRAGMELLRFYQTLYALWVLDLIRFGEPVKVDPQQPIPTKDTFLKPQDSLDFVRRH